MRRDITGTKQCSVVIHTALFYAVEQQLDAGGAWVVKRMGEWATLRRPGRFNVPCAAPAR